MQKSRAPFPSAAEDPSAADNPSAAENGWATSWGVGEWPRRCRARCRPSRSVCLLLLTVASLPVAWASGGEPFFFVQLTDPQFGMYAENADFAQESGNFEFAIATANRLKPAFVVVTGDLVNKPGDAAQGDEYLRIAAKLDRSIPLYNVPGNHDVGNEPTSASIAAYTARFGPDHYSFRVGGLFALVLNSNLIHSPQHVSKEAESQQAWLKVELEKARQQQVRHVVVFQHHSWFLDKPDEPDQYFNLPRQQRGPYLDQLRQYGVRHVFAGHYHGNLVARAGGLEMVTSGPLGKPLRQDQSGLRIVIVRDEGIEHRYYALGEIPHQVDLATAAKGTGAR